MNLGAVNNVIFQRMYNSLTNSHLVAFFFYISFYSIYISRSILLNFLLFLLCLFLLYLNEQTNCLPLHLKVDSGHLWFILLIALRCRLTSILRNWWKSQAYIWNWPHSMVCRKRQIVLPVLHVTSRGCLLPAVALEFIRQWLLFITAVLWIFLKFPCYSKSPSTD